MHFDDNGKTLYLGNTVSAGGECKVAATARTRYRWAKHRECGKILC